MTNVSYKLDGDKLVITVNLSERHGAEHVAGCQGCVAKTGD